MALARDLSAAQLAFQISGGEIDQFLVSRFRGAEGLCQLYRFEIELVSTEADVDFDAVVGKSAVLSVNTSAGERWFHGVIGRFELIGETVGQNYYRAELVPAVWLLTHRYGSRIFQNKTVPEIITDVLTRAGIAADRVQMGPFERRHDAREYCVQYRETDYNFICRLMEEEGIWWCFEQKQEGHIFVLADAPSAYAPLPGEEQKVPFHAPTGMNVEEEHVSRFRLGRSVRPGAVEMNDFNFKNPKLDLVAKSDVGRDEGLEFRDYPGEYEQQTTGSDLAKLRAQEFEAGRTLGVGQSNSHRLAPGRTFDLVEHPTPRFDGKYFVTSVVHQGKQATTRTSAGANGRGSLLDARAHQSLITARQSDDATTRGLAEALLQIATRLQRGDPTAQRALTQWLYHAGQVSRDLASVAGALGGSPIAALTIPNLLDDTEFGSLVDEDAPVYGCRFECIPASVTYRPPRVTPWPVVRGTQTARVVGPEGEEIYTDEYGRVKVYFDWDPEGNEGGKPKLFGADSSCWIRVSHGMAGGGYGMLFLPRVGQEVIVDFLNGNPDNPIIIGRVYNGDHMPPYPLPEEKTKSVIKTHTSKDGGGTNEIRFEDLKDKEQLFIQAQRRMDTRVRAGHFHTVGGSYHLIIGGEKDGELHGEYRQKVFKAKHVHIKGEQRCWIEENEGRVIGQDQAIEVQGGRSTSVGEDDITLVGGGMKHEVTSTAHLKAADVKIEATGTIELTAGGSSVVICGDGVYIVGSKVYINSGPGPTVGPVEGGVCPAAIEDAAAADRSKPGKDTRYSAPGTTPPTPPTLPDVPGHEFPSDDPPVKSWIEIELKDKDGNPVPHEPYRVRDSANRSFTGALDENGFAHIDGVVPGDCEIRFPNRDLTVWKRA